MLRISRPLLAAFAALLLAGPAAALTITPDPVNETRGAAAPGGALDADVHLISISGDTMTVQLSVITGSITRIDLSMLFDSLTVPTMFSFVSSVSSNGGTGDVAVASAINAVNEGQYILAAAVAAGQTSDELVIQFDAAIPATWEGTVTFDNGYATGQTYQVIAAPEPGSMLLFGTLILGGAVMRRRG